MLEPAPLTDTQQALVQLSAALATRDPEVIGNALRSAAENATDSEIDEAILQSHLFVGFPDALNALVLWREIGGRPGAVEATPEGAGWEQRGEDVCARVYGSNYRKLRANVARLHPDLERWMVVGGYGRVIGRAGLDLRTRELCIVALLAVWNVPRQLHSHLRGALNVGASVAQVDRALEIALQYLGTAQRSALTVMWSDVRAAAGRQAAR